MLFPIPDSGTSTLVKNWADSDWPLMGQIRDFFRSIQNVQTKCDLQSADSSLIGQITGFYAQYTCSSFAILHYSLST